MGADIYLNSVTDAARAKYRPLFEAACAKREKATGACREKWQAEVSKYYDLLNPDDGYFRDSYNATGLFHLLGWSWWNMGDEVLDDDGHLPIDNAKDVLAKLEAVQITREEVQRYYEREDLAQGGDSVDEWFKMFTDKRERFMNLLRKSIELNEPLYWSI